MIAPLINIVVTSVCSLWGIPLRYVGTAFASDGVSLGASLDGADDDANQPMVVRAPPTPAIWSPLPANGGNRKKTKRSHRKVDPVTKLEQHARGMVELAESSTRAMAELAESSSLVIADIAAKHHGQQQPASVSGGNFLLHEQQDRDMFAVGHSMNFDQWNKLSKEHLQNPDVDRSQQSQRSPSPSVQEQAFQHREALPSSYLSDVSPTVCSPLGYASQSFINPNIYGLGAYSQSFINPNIYGPGAYAGSQNPSPSPFRAFSPSIAKTEYGFVTHNNEWKTQK